MLIGAVCRYGFLFHKQGVPQSPPRGLILTSGLFVCLLTASAYFYGGFRFSTTTADEHRQATSIANQTVVAEQALHARYGRYSASYADLRIISPRLADDLDGVCGLGPCINVQVGQVSGSAVVSVSVDDTTVTRTLTPQLAAYRAESPPN